MMECESVNLLKTALLNMETADPTDPNRSSLSVNVDNIQKPFYNLKVELDTYPEDGVTRIDLTFNANDEFTKIAELTDTVPSPNFPDIELEQQHMDNVIVSRLWHRAVDKICKCKTFTCAGDIFLTYLEYIREYQKNETINRAIVDKLMKTKEFSSYTDLTFKNTVEKYQKLMEILLNNSKETRDTIVKKAVELSIKRAEERMSDIALLGAPEPGRLLYY